MRNDDDNNAGVPNSGQGDDFWKSIIERLTVPIYIIDADTYKIVHTNIPSQIERLGCYCYEVLHNRQAPCNGKEHACGIKKVVAEGKEVVTEHVHYDESGRKRIIEVHTHPVFGPDGSISQVIEYLFDITHTRGNTHTLKAFFQAIEQSPVSIVITDPEGDIEYVNSKFNETTGYSPGEVIGKNPRIMKDPDRPSSDYTEMWQALKSGNAWKGEFKNRKKDGSLYWESAVISPVFDEQGNLQNFIALKENISEQKRMEEQILLQSKAMEESTSIIAIADATDPELPAIYVNKAFEQRTGYSREEVLGRNMRFLHGSDSDQSGLERIRESIRRKTSCQCLVRNYRKDGSIFWNELSLTPLMNAKGELTHYVGIADDVTEFQAMQKALMENEERLRLSHVFAKIGTWDLDLKTRMLHWSKGIAPLLGLPDEEKTTSYDEFLQLVHPEDRQLVLEAMDSCLRDNREYSVEHRAIWPDGSIHWLKTNGDVFRDDSGKPVRMLGVLQDITSQKNIELELKISREEAYRANKAKSEFLSSMSHELRTPLNAILGFGQLLETDEGLNRDQKDSAEEILRAGEHLLELINEVLDLSKIELGKIDFSLGAVSYAKLLETVLKLMQPMAIEKNITIEQNGEEDAYVLADPVRLKQVVVNLFSNAIKYNRPGGSISITLQKLEGRTRFAITDTGYGISKDKKETLFEPFNRLDAPKRNIEGTGIGLTISKNLVELMGGEIGVDSTENKGSTFWIDLPSAANGPTEPQDTGSSSPNVSSPTQANKPETLFTVLYIEDNPSNLRLMEEIFLREPAYNLISASLPSIGLKLAEAHRPDIILLDMNLPEMDGHDVLQRIRASEWGRDIPVLAITANAMPGEIERGIAAGLAAYLTKPLDIRYMLELIHKLVQSSPGQNSDTPGFTANE